MTYIYNKKISNIMPNIQYESDFKVTLKDVLLSFVGSESRGKSIYITYSISYFNIPQNVKEFEIEKHIDYPSLRKVVRDTVGELDKFTTIYYLDSKKVILQFDAEAFLKSATFPLNVVNRTKLNQAVIKLNIKVPELIVQTSSDYPELLSKVMTSIIRNNSKYRNIFKFFKSWYYSKNVLFGASYDINNNEFVITLQDPFKRIIYYY